MQIHHGFLVHQYCMFACRAGLKPVGPIAPDWALGPILQTLVQVDWEPGQTEIVPNWALHLLRPAPFACIVEVVMLFLLH